MALLEERISTVLANGALGSALTSAGLGSLSDVHT